MSALKILVIPGSLAPARSMRGLRRPQPMNSRKPTRRSHAISLGDFPLPIYDGDLQTKSGVPKNAINLKRMIGAHHGVLIVTRNIILRCRRWSKIPSTG